MKKLFSEIPCIKGERLILKRIEQRDAEGMSEIANSPSVNKRLPTFLFEKRYEDIHYVIDRLYDECIKESLFLGIYLNDEFCGIAEMYGFRDDMHKVSLGVRLRERFWGRGITAEALRMMIDYLYGETDIEIITASTLVGNKAAAAAARKAGFTLVVHASPEDWGYDEPCPTDKWIA